LIIFAVLWALRKKGYVPGTIFWIYLSLAGLARVVVEFWRINPAFAFGLSEAQWFGLAVVAIGLSQLLVRPPIRRPVS